MKICLLGAGSKTIDKTFLDSGYQLGKMIGTNDHTLVFGGGNDGMMGSVARGCYENNGQIIGIIPEWMDEFEELFENCDKVIFTKTMDERKLNSNYLTIFCKSITFFRRILSLRHKDVSNVNFSCYFTKVSRLRKGRCGQHRG